MWASLARVQLNLPQRSVRTPRSFRVLEAFPSTFFKHAVRWLFHEKGGGNLCASPHHCLAKTLFLWKAVTPRKIFITSSTRYPSTRLDCWNFFFLLLYRYSVSMLSHLEIELIMLFQSCDSSNGSGNLLNNYDFLFFTNYFIVVFSSRWSCCSNATMEGSGQWPFSEVLVLILYL